MLMLKIMGLITLVHSFFYGFKKWFEEEKKENLAGLIMSCSHSWGYVWCDLYYE